MLYVLVFVLGLANSNQLDASFTSESQIQHQVDAGIKFMCINQYELDGRFLYEAVAQKNNKIEFNPEENNIPRQAGGLYAIGMYYRLHYNKNKINNEFSIIQCIHNSIRYLKTISIPIDSNGGELIDGNTGATALAMLGMIEICIANHDTNPANHDICNQYLDLFILWLNGLITMRNKKLALSEKISAKNLGAFSKNILKPSKSTDCYDSESYLVFARMLQFKQYLYITIGDKISDKLWDNIINIVNELDQYYLNYRLNYDHQGDTHWFVQSLFSRWITLKYNNNNFMNHYMFNILIQKKLNGKKKSLNKTEGRCFLVESYIDTIYAIQKLINHSKYQHNDTSDSLYSFKQDLWNRIKKRYAIITSKQLFQDFNSSFNGAFFGDELKDHLRIDDTQHCNCALMKLKSLIYDKNSYMNDLHDIENNEENQIIVKNQFFQTYLGINDLLMIGLGCLFTIILLIINPQPIIVFVYWCYYYPKKLLSI